MTMRADQRPELLLNNDKLLKVLDLRSWEVLSFFLFRQTCMTEREEDRQRMQCMLLLCLQLPQSPLSASANARVMQEDRLKEPFYGRKFSGGFSDAPIVSPG